MQGCLQECAGPGCLLIEVVEAEDRSVWCMHVYGDCMCMVSQEGHLIPRLAV